MIYKLTPTLPVPEAEMIICDDSDVVITDDMMMTDDDRWSIKKWKMMISYVVV